MYVSALCALIRRHHVCRCMPGCSAQSSDPWGRAPAEWEHVPSVHRVSAVCVSHVCVRAPCSTWTLSYFLHLFTELHLPDVRLTHSWNKSIDNFAFTYLFWNIQDSFTFRYVHACVVVLVGLLLLLLLLCLESRSLVVWSRMTTTWEDPGSHVLASWQ